MIGSISRPLARPLVLLVAGLALCARTASAQEPRDTFQLGEIVVTATKLPTPLRAVPAAVTVLEGADLRARGIRFVADALRDVPGVSVARTGSYGGLTAAFVRGGESDYVQVLVDGVVLNDPGGAIDLGQLTTDDVERIEIVRGPVSVLYGSDAVTGVIQILTTRGGGRPRLTAGTDLGISPRVNGDVQVCPGYPSKPCPPNADLGSYTTRSWDGALSGARRGAEYAFGASAFDTDGAYAYNNHYANTTMSGRVRLGDQTSDVALSGRRTKGVYHYPTDGAGRLADRNVYRSSTSLALGLEGGRSLTRRLEARAALAWHDGDYLTVDDQDTPADTLGFYASTSTIAIDRRKANAWGNLHLDPGTVATVGVELEKQKGSDDFDSQSQFGPYASSTDNARSNRALYVQVLASPNGRVSATAGARREDNDRFGSYTTWRAGASARLGAGATLRSSAGTAFKEPTFFENYATGFTLGNAALEPERSRSWEIGLEQALLSGRVRLSATWFDQRFRNLIQYSSNPGAGKPNYVNIGEASSRGLETEGHAVGRLGTLSASWTHLTTKVLDAGLGTDALFQEGQPLIRRAPDRVAIDASTPTDRRIRGGASVRVVSGRPDLDFLNDFNGARVILPGYTVVDLFGEVRLLARGGRDLAVRARMENLTGEDYREVANFPAPGRSLIVSLRVGTGL